MRRSGYWATSTVLFLLCLMYIITDIDRVNISTAALVFKGELGLSNTDYGAIFAAFGWSYACFQIVGGRIGDRFGLRLTLGICGFIWALSTIFTGLADGFWGLIIARVALGVGEGATFPTATRAMSSWTRAGWRGFAQGITPFLRALQQRRHAADRRLANLLFLHLARRFRDPRRDELRLGRRLVRYFRDKHSGISEQELATLPPYRGGVQEPVCRGGAWFPA